MLDWLPGYERSPEPDAGLAIGPGADKVVIHTTESPRGSFNAIRNLWRGEDNWGRGLPQFLADGARVVQLMPLSVNAYTMENKAGGVDTNRAGHVIQVEWCRYSKDPWAEDEINALAKWLVDLQKAGLKFDFNTHPRFYGANEGVVLASYNSPIRLQGKAWTDFNGWLGHQHAPENAHWDPGYLDANKVVSICNNLAGKPAEEDEDMAKIIWNSKGAFLVSGLTKRALSPHELDVLRLYKVEEAAGKHDDLLACYTEIPRTKIAGTD